MSNMIPTPPQSIQIGGGQGAPGGGPGAPQGGGDVDPASVKKNLKDAVASLLAAQQAEGDDADAAQIAQLVAKIHTLIAGHQQLQDQVMGGGPGAKIVRKTTPRGGSGY